jgi:hypothetical protein
MWPCVTWKRKKMPGSNAWSGTEMDAIDYWSMNTRSMLLTGYRAHEAIAQVFGQDIVTIRCCRQTGGW